MNTEVAGRAASSGTRHTQSTRGEDAAHHARADAQWIDDMISDIANPRPDPYKEYGEEYIKARAKSDEQMYLKLFCDPADEDYRREELGRGRVHKAGARKVL